ncbi:MAG: HAMP domain-containing protein, partial [Candidatus Latescibacteria bacterium]|nr:HAMP domain-containing protein [Candidatus Latescibacterota bacterium]
MDNLKIRLSLIASGLTFLAMLLGFFGPDLARMAMSDQLDWWQMALAAVAVLGVCGIIIYTQLERALSPVLNLTDHFMRLRAGDLDTRLPIEGPEEMQQMARAFNETMGDLDMQIRDITEEKQAAERGRQFTAEQLEASQLFKSMADAMPIGLVMADANHNAIYQNPASESGFIQLSEFLSWDADIILGHSIDRFFPDLDAHNTLSAPEMMPYETAYEAGPYRIRLQASPILSEEEEYLGPVIVWDVDLVSSKVDENLPDLNEAVLEEMVEEAGILDHLEHEPTDSFGEIEELEMLDLIGEEPEEDFEETEDVSEFDGEIITPSAQHTTQPSDIEQRLTRGSTLVGRSVRLLSERLSTIMSMVEALCSEGDNLHHSLEETRQRTQNATYLTTERSESLWELVGEMGHLEERTRATTMLVKRLKKALSNTDSIQQAIGRLSDSIEHMVIEARLEVGRAGAAGSGMKVIVDEMRRLGRESTRVNKDAQKRIDGLNSDV